MKRYEHYLGPVTGDSFPSIILGFAVESRRIYPPPEGTRIIDTLKEWAITAALGSNGVYGERCTFRGSTAPNFWRAVDSLLDKGKTIWAFADNCLNALALLGVWELLEQGDFELRWKGYAEKQNIPSLPKVRPALGSDSNVAEKRTCVPGMQEMRHDIRSVKHKVRSRRRKRDSLDAKCSAILEDPPTMLWIKRPGQKGSIKLLDIRNYGVSVPLSPVDCMESATVTLDVMGRVIQAIKENRIGSLQITAAGQAYHSFRRRFLRDPVLVHASKSVLDLEGESYVGGRCECIRIGTIKGNAYQFDFRSMYAACYQSNSVPVAYVKSAYRPKGGVSITGLQGRNCIATVEIVSDERAYPYRMAGLVVWPIGRFKTTLCGPELTDAIEKDRIKEVYHVATYRMSHALSDYAKVLHELRCKADDKGDSDLSSLFKLLLVSLPGKLASRGRRWIDCPVEPCDKPYGKWFAADKLGKLIAYRSIAWNVQRQIESQWSNNAVPAAASWVTSLARVKLLNAIRLAGWEDVYYMDTDALIVNDAGRERLRSGLVTNCGTLGSFQEKGSADDVEIYGIKHYRFGGRLVCAGLPKGTTPVAGRNGVYYRREGQAQQAMGGVRPIASGWYYTRRDVATYNHGMVDATGRVHPFVLTEGQ